MRTETHGGVVYAMAPIVCEDHPGFGCVTIQSGMISRERGLICPICYKPARVATEEEADAFRKSVEGAR